MADTTGRTKQAVKHGTKKGFEASTLLALGIGALVPMGVLSISDADALRASIGGGQWLAAIPIVLAAAVRLAPSIIRSFGYTRTADATAAAQAEDSPGGKDFTIGEIAGIAEAAHDDFTGFEDRDGQRGDESAVPTA